VNADPVGEAGLADVLLRLALQAIREHLAGREPQRLLDTLPRLSPPQACFVSLKIRGRLRGCIGTLAPTQLSLEAEIVANAIASSQRDPRFPPVRLEEVERLDVSADLLSPPEPVASAADLDPQRYGVIVRSGGRSGVLLPDLPGVNSAARQIAICREKADIPHDAPVTLERFTVVRLGGPA
jgi:AmmeMemoRadiSam system protein A